MNPAEINADIFRAYDIRGIVDEDLTVDAVCLVGKAFATEVLAISETTVIVGRDGRLSSPKLHDALIEGIRSTGCHVIDIGIVTTPLLYFATHVLSAKSGIMITGSHNPKNYNGLKIVKGGTTLADTGIHELYERIKRQDFSKGEGAIEAIDLVDRYVSRISSDVHLDRQLKVVIDCGNGVGSVTAEKLYRQLGCDVKALYCTVDGNFPNHHPDPSVPKNLEELSQTVKETGADIGLAFDGDADRLGVVTNQGNIIFADRIMMLLAQYVLQKNISGNIVFDVKCSRYLADVIRKNHGEPIMCRTGHSFVKAAVREYDALLGGELSGHIFYKERWYGFDDAVYAGARLLEILASQKETIENLFKAFPDSVNTPELKLPVSEEKKFEFMQQFQDHAKFDDANVITIDGMRVEFKDGWGLIRPSNTTPYLILRFEADNQASLQRIENIFREQLLKLDSTLQLPF